MWNDYRVIPLPLLLSLSLSLPPSLPLSFSLPPSLSLFYDVGTELGFVKRELFVSDALDEREEGGGEEALGGRGVEGRQGGSHGVTFTVECHDGSERSFICFPGVCSVVQCVAECCSVLWCDAVAWCVLK